MEATIFNPVQQHRFFSFVFVLLYHCETGGWRSRHRSHFGT